MSTIKSSAEDLTLNADGSGNDIILQSNGSNVGTLTAEGVLTATSFAGSGASLTGVTTSSAYIAASTDATGTFTGLYSNWNLNVYSENMTMVSETFATCAIAGLYYFIFNSITDNSTTAYEMQWVKNSAAFDNDDGRSYSNVANHDMFSVQQVFRLAVDDTVALRATSTGYVYGSGHGFMRGFKIGD